MIPYSYNMVDMGGIDLAEAHGTVVEGLYNRLALARNACGDLILYNWKFAEIEIAPGICTTLDEGTSILINGAIQVTEQDVVSITTLQPDPPVIVPLEVQENGVYTAPDGVDGYSPVTVNVIDEETALYILNPDVSDAIGAAGGSFSVSSSYSCASHAYAPIVAKNNSSDSREVNFWLPYYSTYAGEANKGYYGRKGFDSSLIYFATKVEHGKYSSLHIRFEVAQGYFSGNRLVLYLQPQLEFTSTAPFVQSSLKTQVLSEGLIQDNIVDVDVSDIEQDFYIAFFQYNGFTKIRSIYLDNN